MAGRGEPSASRKETSKQHAPIRQETISGPLCSIASIPILMVIYINGGTTWAIMTAITNVDDQNPIGDVKEVSCDKSQKSLFPSVNGGKDDVVLFSQGFDDAFEPNDFMPMSGASRLAYVKVNQDVSFLLFSTLIRNLLCCKTDRWY